MSSTAFVLRMALRQAGAARRRLLLLTTSVIAGVAALVAVNSFTDNLTHAVAKQAEELLGADFSIAGRSAPAETPQTQRLLDSLRQAGGQTARVANSVSFSALAFQPGHGGARLVQVRSVDPGWPFYGRISTVPSAAWDSMQHGGAIVDPSLLTALNLRVGDTIALGDGRFAIIGTVVNVPGDIGLQSVFGQRVFIATRAVAGTNLLTVGSRAQYETFLQLPSTIDPVRVARVNANVLRPLHFSLHTVVEDRDSLTRGLVRLGNYLGLVALAALLLGGVGVASAVHVFVRQQLDAIAVLRCLGATSLQVVGINLVLALTMGLIGSIMGALLGVGLQQVVPYVVRDFLPVGVTVLPAPGAIAIGIVAGLWTAAIFAAMPLLRIRDIPPLATLRRNVESSSPRWRVDYLLVLALAAISVTLMAALQVRSLVRGAAFCAGCAVAVAALWVVARLLVLVVRRWTPAQLPYLLRQGLANLHRPANQTVSVMIALGFGAFILATLFVAQFNLLRVIRVEDAAARPNLVLFDIQPEQQRGVDSILAAEHLVHGEYVPIVPMRIRSLKGREVSSMPLRSDRKGSSRADAPAEWAVRREFRSTWRADRAPGERIVKGRWFSSQASGATADQPAEISVESDLAKELGVTLGDSIVWDVQGVGVYSRITSLREVNWAKFEPQFFVVFAPGALDRAPQTWATMVRAADPVVRGRVQREVAEHAANVTAIDIGEVQQAITTVVDRIVIAIRFMALFSLITGLVVLIGSVSTSRWQRVRESTLLRTLGATRAQVLVVLCVEYASLGLGAALVAAALATGAGWALARWIFDTHFSLPGVPLTELCLGLVALTTIIGLWNSADVLNRPPLAVLQME